MLIIFGGLPGTGKTSLARELSRKLRAVYLRIDAIEHGIRASGCLHGEMNDAGTCRKIQWVPTFGSFDLYCDLGSS